MAFYQTDIDGKIWRFEVQTDGSFAGTVVESVSPSNPVPTTLALTGQSIVHAALENLGVIAPEETMEAADLQTGLSALNRMFDAWSADGLCSWSLERKEYTLSLKNPHTIGLGGDFDAPRPAKLSDGQVWVDGSPVKVLPFEQYEASRSDGSARPCVAYYDAGYPFGNLFFDCVPDKAYKIVLYLPKQLAQVDAFTEFSLPQGYAEAVEWGLSVRLAPRYGKQVKDIQAVIAMAQGALAVIKRANVQPVTMTCDSALLGCGSFDIRTGR